MLIIDGLHITPYCLWHQIMHQIYFVESSYILKLSLREIISNNISSIWLWLDLVQTVVHYDGEV